MNDKRKSTFRSVMMLVALLTASLSIAFELYPSNYSGLGMSILSGMCFITLSISFIND